MKDVGRLARTSSMMNECLQEYMYTSVRITPSQLQQHDCMDNKKLNKLRHTKFLSLVHVDLGDGKTNEASLNEARFWNAAYNVDTILKYCDPLSVDLTETCFPPSLMKTLCQYERRVEVRLSKSANLTYELVGLLCASSPNLTKLYLGMCNISDIALQHIGKLHRLMELDLNFIAVAVGKMCFTSTGFANLAHLSILRTLYLRGRIVIEVDETFQQLANLSALRTLDVGGCRITSLALQHVASSLYQLQKLSLSSAVTSNKCIDLSPLVNLKALRDLDLSCSYHLTDDNLKQLIGMIALERLDIKYCHGITHLGIEYLPSLPALRRLNVRGCEGVNAPSLLKMIHQLVELDIREVPDISDQVIEMLRRSIPTLHVSTQRSVYDPMFNN